MITAQNLLGGIVQFTGTTHYYYNPNFPAYRYTDGIKFVAEITGGYWLIDAIFCWLPVAASSVGREFQLWTLSVGSDATAVLTARADTDEPDAVRQEIAFTDFPQGEWKFYVENGVLLLPNEH